MSSASTIAQPHKISCQPPSKGALRPSSAMVRRRDRSSWEDAFISRSSFTGLNGKTDGKPLRRAIRSAPVGHYQMDGRRCVAADGLDLIEGRLAAQLPAIRHGPAVERLELRVFVEHAVA